MNKNEQNRVVAWRLKLLRQASDMPRSVAQTCRHFGLSRKTFYIYGLLPLCKRFSSRQRAGRMRTSIRRQPQSSAVAPRWVIRTRTPLQLVGPVMAYIKIRFRARRFDLSCHLLRLSRNRCSCTSLLLRGPPIRLLTP
jgi:hypothetical protein